MANGSVLREADGKRAFDALKPICVRVMSSPSLGNLGELREKVRCLPVAIHPHLLDYVLLPVRVLFKRCGSDLRLVESGLQTLTTVFSRVDGAESWAVVQELVIYICNVLDPNLEKEATGFVDLSEDVVLAAVEALRAMLLSLTPSVRLKLLLQLPLVGHCVSVLLALLQGYEAKKLRREVLSAMLALSGVDATSLSNLIGHRKPTNQSRGKDDDITEADSEGKSRDDHDPAHILSVLTKYVGVSECAEMGGVFASFLPGITIALTKVMTSDVKVGSSVSVLALLTWAHYVAMVMDNSSINAAETEVGVADKREGAEPRLWPVRRTESWYSETDEKLSVLVQRVCVLVTSEGWRVRLGMVAWAHTILTHCHRSLVKCMPAVLEILVSLSYDDYPLISSTAKLALTSFSNRYSKEEEEGEGEGEGAGLRAIMEERLHSLSSSLPRLLRSQSEAGKVSTLQLLTGYLELLQSRVTNLVNSQPHLNRIVQALLLTMEIEVSDVHIIEHQSPANLPGNPPEDSAHHHQPLPLPPQPSLHFVYFTSDRISSLLQRVCELLGRHGSLPVIVDHLLEKLRLSPSTHGKELLLILSHVLLGAASRRGGGRESAESADEVFVLVEGLLEELVAPGNWDRLRPAGLNFDVRDGESFWREERMTNTKDTCLYSCLQLHVVSMCVHFLGSAFKPLLQTVVYPLLQRLGNEHVSIATAAHATLKYTAAHCGYKTLSELITDNADYLVNSVALHLRGPTHLQALQVLQAVVSHGDESVLLLIQDSIDELFLSLDVRQIEPNLIWPVLRTLAESCERWRTLPKMTSTPSSSTPLPDNSSATQGMLTKLKEGGASHVISDESHVTKYDSDGGSHVTPEAVEEFFLQYHKEKQRREKEGDFSESELNQNMSKEDSHGGGDENDGEDPYNQRRELSPLRRTAVEVMQRCGHHMSMEPPSLRLIVLDTLSHSILALQHEQNTLLPEVHNIWSPFLPRLSDPAPPVARRAWHVMVVLCDVCREFLRKRIIQGVWSSLVHSLESLAPRSRNTDKLYRQTAQCKLQQELLECVGVLSLKLQVSTADLERLAHACAPYLASDQPDTLQQACLVCFQSLIDLDPDAIWLLLEQLRSEGRETTPSSPSLKPYKLPRCPDGDKYGNNVNMLIHRT